MSVSPEHYAQFLERLGHSVRQIDHLWWFNTSRGVYTCFPFHVDVDARSLPLRDILGRDGFVARFGCPLDQGVTSFRILCDDRQYDFPSLRSRTRTQVRRGLEECQVEQIDFATLRKHAIQLNADTLTRQGRRVPANLESYWVRYYEAAAKTPGAETWGAFVEGQLAAYLIAFTINDVANLLILRSALDHLKKFPNNALLFSYLQRTLARPEISQVVYGYESIQADLGSLDQFKTGMGFRQAPVGQRIELASWARPVLNRYTAAPAIHLLRRLGYSETSAKLQGILNWYQQQPVEIPSAVQPRRAA
ncbi:MAG: hypothetical protein KDA96_12185 [Planctomycetaceae bacterium]|nr:hypothetical protein [Planctomycetaceae bacterium]